MRRTLLFNSIVIFGALTLITACSHTGTSRPTAAPDGYVSSRTALDAYIEKDDPNYKWDVVSQTKGDGVTSTVVHMVSQQWLTEDEVDRTLWEHHLTIVVPDDVTSNIGLLMIGGGKNGGAPPEPSTRLLEIALATGGVVAELRQVPNQPLVFAGDNGRKRSEDSLIAFGWDKVLRGGRSEWMARFPMTKSAVRAMDTITDFCATAEGGAHTIDQFVVAGGSKRGWTTWTTAAVDDRVVAICPIVIDLLNVVPSFEHHWRAYGFWAPAVDDYEEMRIMEWINVPAYHDMLKLTEPYWYRDRMTMPKLILNASGDQFFLPDSSQFYWDDLPGVKRLRYVPNAGHSMGGTDAGSSLLAFYESIIRDSPLPKYEWRVDEDGTITVKTQEVPQKVLLWYATNPDARDFRWEGESGIVYQSESVLPVRRGLYKAAVPTPKSGWTAFFIELTYDTGGVAPHKFTTEVVVVPDTYPYEPFVPEYLRED